MRSNPPISIKIGNNGLESLIVNKVEFLKNGDFRVHRVLMKDPAGRLFDADLSTKATLDAAGGTLCRSYGWGAIKVRYRSSANRLALTITTANHSPDTIQGIFYEPFTLQFPSPVREYDGSIPLIESNLGGPTLLTLSYDTGVLLYANDDPSKPLMSGFPWALDKPSRRIFPLEINTDRQKMYPTFYPYIARPIPPGATDEYQVSLRFGRKGATLDELASDVRQKFLSLYPQEVKWPDRRPIGMIFLSTAGTRFDSNPRGYFNDPNINTLTNSGSTDFRNRLFTLADRSIEILRDMNAQGVLVWDIEGQEFRNASYVGDPTQFEAASPEMTGCADDFFKRFRDAGLRVGVCIRPQEFVLERSRNRASQLTSADPKQVLLKKIDFARRRWGATMFYVDSNGGPSDPMDAAVFRRLLAERPDVLLIPEHKNALYHAYSAPYRELRQGFAATPPDIRQKNNAFFSVINTADGPIREHMNDLVSAVRQGDILLFRAWFDDEPANESVRNAYRIATGSRR